MAGLSFLLGFASGAKSRWSLAFRSVKLGHEGAPTKLPPLPTPDKPEPMHPLKTCLAILNTGAYPRARTLTTQALTHDTATQTIPTMATRHRV